MRPLRCGHRVARGEVVKHVSTYIHSQNGWRTAGLGEASPSARGLICARACARACVRWGEGEQMRVTARARMRGAHSVGLARAAFGSRLPRPEFEVARHQRARPHARSQEPPAAKECVEPLGARAQQAGLAVAGCHLAAPQVENDVNEKNTTPHLRRRARATAPKWTTCKRVAGGARARTRANTSERASGGVCVDALARQHGPRMRTGCARCRAQLPPRRRSHAQRWHAHAQRWHARDRAHAPHVQARRAA